MDLPSLSLLSLTGRGSFGEVRLSRCKSKGVYYAIKVMDKRRIIREKCRAQTEIEVMASLSHPFLCHLYCAYQVCTGIDVVMKYLFPRKGKK